MLPEVIRRQMIRAFWLIILLFACPSRGTPQASQDQPHELARRVVQNELRAEGQDRSHWMFRLETEKNDGQTEVDEVIETKDGDLKLPVLINGSELTPKQQHDFEK